MKLDRPLHGDEATGTLARVLAFRRTVNPPDIPGEPIVYFGTVAKLPGSSCPASAAQQIQRNRYAAAAAAWRALTHAAQDFYNINKPANLTGFNFFIRLYLLPSLAYFGYCIFGLTWFQRSTTSEQPAAAEYEKNFPEALDEFPLILDGFHSPQAWLFNNAYDTIRSIENYLILNKSTIEGG